MDLLEKASIILTPTAYNNGEALCVKPSDGSGDFDFSRNSAATRVNAQGLVENVQILSSNLVQNGDFSEEGVQEVSNGSFSQEGAEEIVNGSFDTDSDWDLGNGWSIGGGEAVALNSASGQRLSQDNILQVGKIYKLTYEVKSISSGGFKAFVGGVALQAISNIGVYTEIMTTPTINDDFFIRTLGTTTGSIDNVSVKEVGQDWTFGTGWSVGDGVAISDGSNGYSFLQQTGAVENGKSYKLTYSVTNYVSGTIEVGVGGASNNNIQRNSVGDFVEYHTSNGTNLTIISRNFNGSITNISVKEVGQNWALGTGWEIGDNVAISDTTASNLTPSTVLISGEKYKFTLDVAKISVGSFTFLLRFNGTNTTFATINTEGSFTFYATADATGFRLQNLSGGTTDFSVTNITAVQITDDTNLPRINYEGFSYQDALGSELVTNGDFATDSDWSKGAGWSISDGVATQLGGSSTLQQSGVLTANKRYKLTFEITQRTSGSVRCYFGGVYTTYRSSIGTYTEYVTNGSTSTFFVQGNAAFIGSIDNVSVKEYLGQEPIPNSGCGHWLWEPQSTNLITYSEDFSQWLTISASATDNYATSPDGTTNASRFLTTSTGAYLYLSGISVSNSTVYTISVYAKSNGNNLDDFRIYTSLGDSTTLTTTSQWQRFTYTFTTSATSINVGFRPSGSQNADILIYGYQIEQQSYATSYIPTNGEANGVTRNQDVCTNGGSLASINSTEGVLYAEIAALADNDNSYIGLFGSSNSRVRIVFSNQIKAQLFNGSYQCNIGFTQSQTNNNKIAFKYKENDFALWINGVEVGTDTSGLTFSANTLSYLNLGSYNGASNLVKGKTKCVAVFPYLSDEELTELTTI